MDDTTVRIIFFELFSSFLVVCGFVFQQKCLYRAVLKISDAHGHILEKGVNTCIYRYRYRQV